MEFNTIKITPSFVLFGLVSKLDTLFLYNPAIVLLSFYPNELEIYVYTKTSTWVITVA